MYVRMGKTNVYNVLSVEALDLGGGGAAQSKSISFVNNGNYSHLYISSN